MGVFASIHARAQSLWHSGGRVTVALRAGAAAALVGAAFVTASASASSEPAIPTPVAASGAFSTWNSLGGQPILNASDMHPGDEVDGAVRIKNTGDMNGRFTLLKHALADPGARSSWLQVRVHDISSASAPVPVYEGSLAAMPAATQLAGEFGPNEQRHYRFRVKFEPPSPAPGVHAAATTSVAFTWEAVAEAPPALAPAPAPPTPSPAPAPAPQTPPPAPARARAPAPAPAPPAPAKAPSKAPARAPSKPKSCAKKVSARKMTAAAKKRALAACKKKPTKKPTKKAAKSKKR